MEKFKNVGLVGLAIAVLVLSGFLFSKSTVVEHTNTIQAGAAGPDFYAEIGAHNNITVGGGYRATSSANAAETLTASDIVNSRVIEQKASQALTLTLPTNAALSSAGFLPNAGDTKTVYLMASTSAITVAGNSGVLLFAGSTTRQVAASSTGRLDFVRLGATSNKVIHVFLNAD